MIEPRIYEIMYQRLHGPATEIGGKCLSAVHRDSISFLHFLHNSLGTSLMHLWADESLNHHSELMSTRSQDLT